MRYLILICSAHIHAARRQAVRATWLPRLWNNMSAKFIVGHGPPVDEPDIVQVDAPDDYYGLPCKMREAFRYALTLPDWDYVFKVDDDTYVVPERLESVMLLGPGRYAEWVGRKHEEFAAGGAGYVISRRIVEFASQFRLPVNYWHGEDGWCSAAARRCKAQCHWTEQFVQELEPYPTPDNFLVTTHWCNPCLMRKRHAQYLCATPAPPPL